MSPSCPVNSSNTSTPSALVIFWAIEMLTALELLTAAGVVHGAIGLGSWILRDFAVDDDHWYNWSLQGAPGWQYKVAPCLVEVVPGMVRVVPSMVRVVPSMVRVVPSVVPSMVRVVACMVEVVPGMVMMVPSIIGVVASLDTRLL